MLSALYHGPGPLSPCLSSGNYNSRRCITMAKRLSCEPSKSAVPNFTSDVNTLGGRRQAMLALMAVQVTQQDLDYAMLGLFAVLDSPSKRSEHNSGSGTIAPSPPLRPWPSEEIPGLPHSWYSISSVNFKGRRTVLWSELFLPLSWLANLWIVNLDDNNHPRIQRLQSSFQSLDSNCGFQPCRHPLIVSSDNMNFDNLQFAKPWIAPLSAPQPTIHL